MTYNIYITHELIMKGYKIYSSKTFKYAEDDFDQIDSIEKLSKGDCVVRGTLHLWGYKIAGDGFYSGFYDVINQQYYTNDYIKNAKIIEIGSECIYHSPVKPKMLRKKCKILK